MMEAHLIPAAEAYEVTMMNTDRKLYVLISFDMESDIGSWGNTHTGVIEGTAPILQVLAHHQVPATFLYTGNAALAGPESLAMVKAASHEIGCHTLQHESVGTPIFEAPGIPPVLPEEVFNRLKKATELIEEKAGVRPVSFRAPRGWGGNKMIQALDQLGYWVDSSYMAYFHGEHLLPYHPSAHDWRKPGDLRILEIPLFADLTVPGELPDHRDRDGWPKLRTHGGRHLADMVRRNAERMWAAGKPMMVCLYLHPWEFVPMPTVLDTDEARIEFKPWLVQNCGQRALDELDIFITEMQRLDARFYTLRDFREVWVRDYEP
jgi:peptidoglycan/xylan/chitin deacetylase (PgdA/CDA1 family)